MAMVNKGLALVLTVLAVALPLFGVLIAASHAHADGWHNTLSLGVASVALSLTIIALCRLLRREVR